MITNDWFVLLYTDFDLSFKYQIHIILKRFKYIIRYLTSEFQSLTLKCKKSQWVAYFS